MPQATETKFIDEAEIARLLGMRREYVRDRLVKRPDFPTPSIVLSQKIRRWSETAVRQWIESQHPGGGSPSHHDAGNDSRGVTAE